MEKGLLYVVYNNWINDPKTHKKPYKIGITKKLVEERYHNLKIPGKFETKFAYVLNDYKEAERSIRNLFKNYRLEGEWFNLTNKELSCIEKYCKLNKGKRLTDKIKNKMKMETVANVKKNIKLADLFVKILKKYKGKGISVVWVSNSYIYWVTEKMDNFLPPGEDNTGSSKDGRKYHYLYDVRSRTVYLEFCPYKQDTKTLVKMNKIITDNQITSNDPVTSKNKYRRIYKRKLNFNKDYSNASIIIRSAIDYLLDV